MDFIKTKQEILDVCGVVPTEHFDVEKAVKDRIKYLKQQLINTGLNGYVLGISGGVDSATVGKLCQLAVKELEAEGHYAKFIAVRLPSFVQQDEVDAQRSLDFINPDVCLTINIGAAANSLSLSGIMALDVAGKQVTDQEIDFHKGNIKARLRMAAQYQVAGFYKALVIGTDHNSENVTGFFTKFGDGACDLIVLNGVNKRQVRLMAQYLGAPQSIYSKAPTADLEELNPGKLDDEGFGFAYDKLDDFLEGKPIDKETEIKIVELYLKTQHKRLPIVSFQGDSK